MTADEFTVVPRRGPHIIFSWTDLSGTVHTSSFLFYITLENTFGSNIDSHCTHAEFSRVPRILQLISEITSYEYIIVVVLVIG